LAPPGIADGALLAHLVARQSFSIRYYRAIANKIWENLCLTASPLRNKPSFPQTYTGTMSGSNRYN
jgi:hypothetical protein